MTRAGAEAAVLTSAVVTVGVWGFRKVIEPAAQAAPEAAAGSRAQALAKIAGAAPTPASTAQFAVAYGFVFVTLSTLATFAPDLAGGVAIMVAVGELLTNGTALFTDILNQVGGTVGEPAKPAKGKGK